MTTRVYYIPLDQDLQEQPPAIPVELLPDGSADLSRLPSGLQDQLSSFGIPDPAHLSTVFPKDGELFLESLLEMNDPYQRFRFDPEIRKPL